MIRPSQNCRMSITTAENDNVVFVTSFKSKIDSRLEIIAAIARRLSRTTSDLKEKREKSGPQTAREIRCFTGPQ